MERGSTVVGGGGGGGKKMKVLRSKAQLGFLPLLLIKSHEEKESAPTGRRIRRNTRGGQTIKPGQDESSAFCLGRLI